ncbi:NAD(P)/FAD-dependent oxidoreductase [Microbacterium album]|uniref:Thioredoxin reductase n=1 Tax=Microbacterium album TaxID=2053191 RepID=A0A917IBZ8_9MICO|nr:FAD-dependent oxidoreductase [Microbacterium album]GGH36767.1 thioredoxin reductase [Microbacterium album]
MTEIYDVTVVGAGTAGLTAARRAAEGGARVLIVERMGAGGQVSTVEGITNFPGQEEPIAGYDLGVQLLEEAEAAGAEVVLAQVDALAPEAEGWVLSGNDEEFRSRIVILAVGSTRRALGVPGEDALEGRGVSHCASCDGPFFRGKQVVVVGGGDSAFDEARILAEHAHDVLIVHTGDAPTAREEIRTRALENANIRVQGGATVSAILGRDGVEGVTIRDEATGAETETAAQGVFVYVGLDPNTDWLADLLERDATGRLVVDGDLATSRAGVFAAGDVRSGTAAMLSESVTDGEVAARAALARLAQVAPDTTAATA